MIATGTTSLSDDRLVKVLSMKEPPSQTFAFLLRDLYEIPGDLIACLEWQRIPSDRMRRDIQARRRHFFNKRVSLLNYVSADTRLRRCWSTNPPARRSGSSATR